VECHNPDKAKSALDLTSLQSILRGGDRGASVIPGRPDDSNLYKFLSADSDPHMPPGNRKKLSEEEAGLIKAWIEKMAVVGAEPPTATLSNVPPAHPSTPAKPRIAWKPSDRLGPAQVVDRFLELAWKLDKVEPAKRASDEVFVRRVYLDLAGRIPTRAEAEAFVRDPGREKRARLIDQLLAGDEYPRHMREACDPVLMDQAGSEWEDRRANEKWFAWLEEAF